MSNMYIRIGIMIVAAIGLLIGWSQSKKGAEWGQPMTILCAIIAIVAALWGVIRQLRGSDAMEAIDRERAFQQFQTEKLGRFLAEQYAGKKIVIIYAPRVTIEKDNAYLGLIRGLGDKVNWQKVQVPLPPGTTDETYIDPIEMWFDCKKFDETVASCGDDVAVYVSLVGMPIRAKCDKTGKFSAPSKAVNSKFAVASGTPRISQIVPYIANKGIIATVTYKPDGIFDESPAPKKMEEAFDKRYLFVTPDNLQELMTKYPDLFKN